jgi:hypothetical protein
MLIVLLIGFAKTGTAVAITASSVMLRTSDWDFMRVNSFPSKIESAADHLQQDRQS